MSDNSTQDLKVTQDPKLSRPSSLAETVVDDSARQSDLESRPPILKLTDADGKPADLPNNSPSSRRSSITLVADDPARPAPQLSSLRKHLLLAAFATATFVDICNVSGVRLTVAQIGQEIGLAPSQAVWVINSYSLCLAAFLLLAGRLADIFRPDFLFLGGLSVMGALSLAVSFVRNKYGFLVLRCLGGIAGAFVIPAAYRLTVGLFPDKVEQKKKLSLLSVASGLGGVLGLLLAGAVTWNWFFRMVAIVCAVSFTRTSLLLPKSNWLAQPAQPFRWSRVDLVGAALIIASLTCFNLALTEGPLRNWSGVLFILTITIAPILAILFFGWERLLNDHRAMLPPSVWKIPTAVTSSLVILVPFPFWATTQVQYATWYQEAGRSPIMVAVALLPQGITSLICGVFVQFRPQVVSDPRFTIPICGGGIIASYILLVFSDGGLGLNYWKFVFPAFIVGSGGAMLVYFASSVHFISNCPAEMAGVAGAWTQVTTHVAGTVCLVIQTALAETGESNQNWETSGRRGFLFMIAWTTVFCGQYFLPTVYGRVRHRTAQ